MILAAAHNMEYSEDKTPEEREEAFAQLEPREKLVAVLRAEVMALDQALSNEVKLREDLQLTLGRAQRLGREMVEALEGREMVEALAKLV